MLLLGRELSADHIGSRVAGAWCSGDVPAGAADYSVPAADGVVLDEGVAAAACLADGAS